jgi:hypothetical protein
MGDNKTLKNFKKYICVSCDFECRQKCDINRHVLTAKHKKNMERLQEVTTEVTKKTVKCICECGNEYFHRQGLSRHKKLCNFKKVTINDIKEEEPEKNNKIINLLIEDNKEFKNIIIQQNAAILELTKNGINSNNTNINNTTNKTTFNLNFFLNDTCKDALNISDFFNSIQLTYLDFINVGSNGYIRGISQIFNNSMKKFSEIERPIHCTDEKRGTIYIKDNNKWEKDDEDSKKLNSLISKIATKNFREVTSYKKKFPDCTKSSSKHSDIYNKSLVEAMGGAGDNENEKKEKIKKSILKTVLIKTK